MPERAHLIRISQTSALALVLMGCGAPPAPQATAPIGPAPATADIAANDTGGPAECVSSFNTEMGEQNLQPAFGDDGYQVWATPGSLRCSPAVGGAAIQGPVTCDISGPAEVRYADQNVIYYHIAAGETATLRIGDAQGQRGAPSCVVGGAQP